MCHAAGFLVPRWRDRSAPPSSGSQPERLAPGAGSPSTGEGAAQGRYAPAVIHELLEARVGEDYELYAHTINPQFMRVLKTIGFDRVWARAAGQYLYDEDGSRYLDMLGGFGMFNVGRNNARVRAALVDTLELETPGSVQLGVSLLPAGYLEGAQELCRRYGTLFAVDEVQTGFGRTGRLFAFEHWGLEPDLVTVAKSLSGGYVPVGALLMAQRVYDAVFDSLEHSVSHGSTFAPNDLAMAAGLATLRELDDAELVARSARLGELLLEQTRALVEAHDVVREVRGLGLMWAVEFAEPTS